MSIYSRNHPHQLIDEHKNFNISAIKQTTTHLQNIQKQYFSTAIIGLQNSGKSTLLNNLFGTNFDVLHEVAGTRTTRGILVSLDKTENLIIMDVEGNDSMDRIEQQDYEKMVATFALSSADVLIMNIWSQTLGQYTGSQYETLTKILEICIEQFKQQSPKVILFCVRDFNDEVDDQGQIRRKIIKDVQKIWLKIDKPQGYERYNQNPEKFFTVEVSVLRRYREEKPKFFLQDVEKLRKRFTDPKDQGYIFAKKKTSFNLPLKDLPILEQNSWESIKVNKKLNLPNQKEQLANFRCSDIMRQISSKFNEEIKKIEENNHLVDFGKLQQIYIKQYELKTYLYSKNIVGEKQALLKDEIKSEIKKTIQKILEREEKRLKQEFKEKSLQVDRQNSMSLGDRLNQIKLSLIDKFGEVFKAINYEVEGRKERIQQLLNGFEIQIKNAKQKLVVNLKQEFEKEYSRVMRLLSSQVLNKYFGVQFWGNVNEKYKQKKEKLLDEYEQKIQWAQKRRLEPAEFDTYEDNMSDQLKKEIRQQLQKSLINRVFDHFLFKFTKNKDGNLYNFNILQEAKISQIYDLSRQQCQQIVQSINEYNVRRSNKSSIFVFEDEVKDEFFQATWLSNALNELDKKFMAEHQTIIRRKVKNQFYILSNVQKQSQMRKVPWWLLVIILYFVYDDLWFPSEDYPIINSLLTLMLIFLTFFFAIGQQSAFMEIWNLLLDVIKSVTETIKEKLKGNK